MPGPNKTFETFQMDQRDCKAYAADQVKGQAEAANQRTAGAAVLGTLIGAGLGAAVGSAYGNAGAGAAIGAGAGLGTGGMIGANNGSLDQMNIQQQYDNAFSQCMYSKGDQVPGFAPRYNASAGGPAVSSVSSADPMVQATQSELIRLGYLQGGADGYIGPKTRGAISAFESSHGLPADGTPSPTLLARLQGTPTGGGATASAPSTWVAPAGSGGATTPASAPAAPSNWVAPTKSQ